MSTSHHRPPLERRQLNAASGTQATAHPRIAEQRLRNALHAVIADPTAKSGQKTPAATEWRWHALTRDRSSPLPCANERMMLHDAIRSGCTTRDQVLSYYLARIQDDMAQFPDAHQYRMSDVLFVRAMAEVAEAQERIAIAHTVPSVANRDAAVKDGREAEVMLGLVCTTYELGNTLPFPGARS